MGRPAVFLDRDGVLVEAIEREGRAYAPLSLSGLRVVPGARREVARLREAGFLCFVVTNQPEVARGELPLPTLEKMHGLLRRSVVPDEIFVCAHDSSDGCACHKPKPGMLLAAGEKWGVDLARSFLVGDRWRDIEAGRAVGAFTILLERPYSESSTADAHVATLGEAVDLILRRVSDGVYSPVS